jgi:heat shock protein HtpX
MAHELTHIANRDVMVMTLAAFFASLASMIVQFGFFFGGGDDDDDGPGIMVIILVSLAVYVISFFLMQALSRYREFAADRGSALITGAPENLMSALQKISSDIVQIPQRDLREVQGMNAFFIIPTNWKSQMSEWLMDHPPLEKRIAALSEIAREMGRPVA